MNTHLATPLFALCAFVSANALALDLSPERLAGYLQRFPDADTNKDGTLSVEEARAYYAKMRGPKAETSAAPAAAKPVDASDAPTFADVHYGPYERNVLDLWQAKSDTPTPLVVYIHGGGFLHGDKSGGRGQALRKECLAAGVSFAAINYRYRDTAPIQDVLRDCARAIQFMRSKASEWNLDKKRFASYGGSAGAGTSLWLAFHDDLADPNNADPVLRESSRLSCAGASSTQFSYDILRWTELFGEESVKEFSDPQHPLSAFYGLASDEDLQSPAGQKIRADCDMAGMISKDDPAVFLVSSRQDGAVENRGVFLHHPKHAKAIYDRCKEIGVPVVASLPGLKIEPPADAPADMRAFLFKYLDVAAPVGQ